MYVVYINPSTLTTVYKNNIFLLLNTFLCRNLLFCIDTIVTTSLVLEALILFLLVHKVINFGGERVPDWKSTTTRADWR